MATINFRARKEFTWQGELIKVGEFVEIEEGNPRLNALLNQSRHIEYANVSDANLARSPLPIQINTFVG